MPLQPHTAIFIGILLLSLVTVESGGLFLLRIHGGTVPANHLQKAFFRAGHAHAGVLLILSIVILGLIDRITIPGGLHLVAKLGVPVAAILMPAGFFFSVMGRDPQRPNGLIALIWLGAISLALGLLTSGIGLIAAGARALS